MAKKGQKFIKYEQEFIDKIVKEKLEGKSYRYLSKEYNIPEGTIATWVHKYNKRGHSQRLKQGLKKKPENQTIDDLRLEIEILKKFQAFIDQQQEEK